MTTHSLFPDEQRDDVTPPHSNPNAPPPPSLPAGTAACQPLDDESRQG